MHALFVLSCSHPFVGLFCTLFEIPFLPCTLAPLHHVSFKPQMTYILLRASLSVYLLFISTIWHVGFTQIWMHPFGKTEDVAWTSSMYGAVWSASKTPSVAMTPWGDAMGCRWCFAMQSRANFGLRLLDSEDSCRRLSITWIPSGNQTGISSSSDSWFSHFHFWLPQGN